MFKKYLYAIGIGISLLLASVWAATEFNPGAFEELLPTLARDKLFLAKGFHQNTSVVILGDSFPATSLDPSVFDSTSLNLAIPGANPLDAYQVLKASSMGQGAIPHAIIISFDMEHLVYSNSGVNNGGKVFPVLFTTSSSDELIRESRRVHEDHFAGAESPFDIDSRLTWLLRENDIGNLNAGSLGSALTGAYSQNKGKCDYEESHQGFLPVEVMVPVDPKLLHPFINGDASLHLEHFVADPLLDDYFDKTLELANTDNIPIYYVRGPEPTKSDHLITKQVKSDFQQYLRNYELKYKHFHVLGDLFSIYPDDFFYDGIHLNQKSVGPWSQLVKSEIAAYSGTP